MPIICGYPNPYKQISATSMLALEMALLFILRSTDLALDRASQHTPYKEAL